MSSNTDNSIVSKQRKADYSWLLFFFFFFKRNHIHYMKSMASNKKEKKLVMKKEKLFPKFPKSKFSQITVCMSEVESEVKMTL